MQLNLYALILNRISWNSNLYCRLCKGSRNCLRKQNTRKQLSWLQSLLRASWGHLRPLRNFRWASGISIWHMKLLRFMDLLLMSHLCMSS
jgi:hypothetical protein